MLSVVEGCLRPNYSLVARELGVTHTAVIKRVSRLLDRGLVKFSPLINVEGLGFKLVLILLEVVNDEYISKLLERFRECPRIIHMFKVLGDYNLAVLAYAEDESVLNAMLGTCMLRTANGIRRSSVIPVTSVLLGEYLRIRVPRKEYLETPCGLLCSRCVKYVRRECIGCPATIYYRGTFSTIPPKKLGRE